MIEDPAAVAARMAWEVYDLRGKSIYLGVPADVLKWIGERWPSRKVHVRVTLPGGKASLVDMTNSPHIIVATAKCLNRPFGSA